MSEAQGLLTFAAGIAVGLAIGLIIKLSPSPADPPDCPYCKQTHAKEMHDQLLRGPF